MKTLEAAHYIARELEGERAKLVILSGSAARGKERPNDLDISAVFPDNNSMLNYGYITELSQRLRQEVRQDIDLFQYAEGYVDSLIDRYRESPTRLCWYLARESMSGTGRWKGWPLAWIIGENAKERLSPHACFQEEFVVLAGSEYLTELRRKINTPLQKEVPAPIDKKRSLRSLLRLE